MDKCPKCGRFGVEQHGNGFEKCLWDDCDYQKYVKKPSQNKQAAYVHADADEYNPDREKLKEVRERLDAFLTSKIYRDERGIWHGGMELAVSISALGSDLDAYLAQGGKDGKG